MDDILASRNSEAQDHDCHDYINPNAQDDMKRPDANLQTVARLRSSKQVGGHRLSLTCLLVVITNRSQKRWHWHISWTPLRFLQRFKAPIIVNPPPSIQRRPKSLVCVLQRQTFQVVTTPYRMRPLPYSTWQNILKSQNPPIGSITGHQRKKIPSNWSLCVFGPQKCSI